MYKKGLIKTLFLLIVAILIVIGSAVFFVVDAPDKDLSHVTEHAQDTLNKNTDKIATHVKEKGKHAVGAAIKDVGEKMADESQHGYCGAYKKTIAQQYEKVVLFFVSDECDACTALVAHIMHNQDMIPRNTAILTVDIDNKKAKKYNVDAVETFVYLDATGNEVRRWTHSKTLTHIISNTQ